MSTLKMLIAGKWVAAASGASSVEIRADLAGRDRVLVTRYGNERVEQA